MDLSKEYIKTCDCKEIQDGWKPTRGDNYILGDAMPNNKHFAVIVLGCCWEKCSGCRCEVEDLKAECIWLPRQDQLQGMLPKRTTWFENLYRFYEWMTTHDPSHFSSPCTMFSSMEQLWLAFVMWELYQKRWDGKEWRAR